MNQPVASPSPRPRPRWIAVTLILTLAVIMTAGVGFWLRQERITRIQTGLPSIPAKSSNTQLHDLLLSARIAASTGRLKAVAELGQLFHANEYRPEAEACWRLLIREQPGEGRWHYYLSDLQRMVGDYPAAEASLERTVAADPTAATAWRQLAEMKFKSGRIDAAESDYRRRLTLLPGDPYAELGLARVAQLRKQPDVTLSKLERIMEKHPKFSAAHNLYAELQSAAGSEELADQHRWLGREAGRYRETDDPWMNELNARCHDAGRLCHLGVIAYQTNQGDRGHANFERALALAPNDPLAYQLLGTLLLEHGDAKAAQELLARGISLAKDATPAPLHFVKLSEACRSLNLTEPAHQALRDGLRVHPDSPDLLHAHGNLLKIDGRNNEAATAYRRALELDPSFVEADFALAILLLESGRHEEAVGKLQHALTMQPTFPKALLLLARLDMDSRRFESAGGYLLPLLKANPGDPDIRQITARWRLQAGNAVEKSDPAAAERHYRAGLALAPDHPELNVSLGVRLLITDRVSESIPLLEKYHRLQPTNPQAALFLGQAYARTNRMREARQVLTSGLHEAERTGQTGTARNFREILTMLQ